MVNHFQVVFDKEFFKIFILTISFQTAQKEILEKSCRTDLWWHNLWWHNLKAYVWILIHL